MSDAVQTELKVPEIDWDHYDTGAKFPPPPQAKDASGRYQVFYAQLPQSFEETAFGATKEGFLKVEVGPLTFINNGEAADGYVIKFASLSAKQYTDRKSGKPLEASQLGNFLRAAEVESIQPKTLDDYKAAVRAAGGKLIPLTLEWELYDRTTKQQLKSRYAEFEGADGQKSPVVTLPDGRRLVARAVVKNYISARS